jgi:hypothetical protein
MPRGGHFPAMEEPELLAEDIRSFLRPLVIFVISVIKSLGVVEKRSQAYCKRELPRTRYLRTLVNRG